MSGFYVTPDEARRIAQTAIKNGMLSAQRCKEPKPVRPKVVPKSERREGRNWLGLPYQRRPNGTVPRNHTEYVRLWRRGQLPPFQKRQDHE